MKPEHNTDIRVNKFTTVFMDQSGCRIILFQMLCLLIM
jgi:hypothetical protein